MSLITVRPTSKANRLLWNMVGFDGSKPQDLVLLLQTYYIVRAHRSHHGAQAPVALALIDQAKRDRWFESNCHHHSEALVDQGLPLFYPPGITAEGFTFFRVHFGDVNSSGRHSVHTVVWLSCRKIGVALLVESTGFVSSIFRYSRLSSYWLN